MKAANKKFDPVTYAGAGHGFMRAGEDPANEAAANATGDDPDTKKKRDMAVANKKARTESWARWLSLLKTDLVFRIGTLEPGVPSFPSLSLGALSL